MPEEPVECTRPREADRAGTLGPPIRWLRLSDPMSFPSRRAREAIKTALAVTLAYGIALWMDWDKPSWAGFAVAMISLSTVGQSLNKGAMRMLGTLVGAVAALVFLAWFPQDRWGLAAASLHTVPAPSLVRPFALGTILTGLIYVFIMPRLSGFGELGPMIFLVIFGIAYVFWKPQQGLSKLGATALPWWSVISPRRRDLRRWCCA